MSDWRASKAGSRAPGAAQHVPLPPMPEPQTTPTVRVHGLWTALYAALDVLTGCAQATATCLSGWARRLLVGLGLLRPKPEPKWEPKAKIQQAQPTDDGKLFRTENGTLLSPYLHDEALLRANRRAYAAALGAGKPLPHIEELRALAALFGLQLRVLKSSEPDGLWRERERTQLTGPCRGFVDLYCPISSELPWQVLFDGPQAQKPQELGRALAERLGAPPDPASVELHQEVLRALHKMPMAPAHDDKDVARARLMPERSVVPSSQSFLQELSFIDAFYCAVADASPWPYCRAVFDGVLRGQPIAALRDNPELLGAFGMRQDDAPSKSIKLKRRLVAQIVQMMRAEVARRLLDERHTAAVDSMMQFALLYGRPVDAL